MASFLDALRTQRWDDHRYYHHSRINQSLHLVSAVSFLFSYVMIFKDPAVSALAGWLVAMTTRQSGHFFFEPKDYDHVNHATHEYKEEIKVGYNLRRKVVLLSDLGAVAAAALFRSDAISAFSRRPPIRPSSSAKSPKSGLRSASAACCSAPSSCSSSRTCRPAWSGRPKS
jgi:hypothetical protein